MEDSGCVECCCGPIRGDVAHDFECLEFPFTTGESVQEWIAGVS
jgi:hypothetical protein